MSIDKSKIKVGDQVKVRLYGWVESDWVPVTSSCGIRVVGRESSFFSLASNDVEVTEHKPDLADLKQAIKDAQERETQAKEDVRKAVAALKVAETGNLRYAYGKRVYYVNFEGKERYGTVVKCPDYLSSIDSESKVWANWDRTGPEWPNLISGDDKIGHMPVSSVKLAD